MDIDCNIWLLNSVVFEGCDGDVPRFGYSLLISLKPWYVVLEESLTSWFSKYIRNNTRFRIIK